MYLKLTGNAPSSISTVTFTVMEPTPVIKKFLDDYAPKPGCYTVSLAYLRVISGSMDAEVDRLRDEYLVMKDRYDYLVGMQDSLRVAARQMYLSGSAYCKTISTTGSWAP